MFNAFIQYFNMQIYAFIQNYFKSNHTFLQSFYIIILYIYSKFFQNYNAIYIIFLIHIFFVSNLCFSAMINYFNAKCVTLIFLRNISINLRNPAFILRNKITSILSYKIKKCYLIIFQ